MTHNNPRNRHPLAALLVCCLALSLTPPAAAELTWHWKDDFSASQQARLQTWVAQTVTAVESYAAPFPFDIDVYFHSAAGGEAVPWANTIRWQGQGVALHVSPDASARDLREDWTAYHEFSHLLLPYLGRANAWFAEGFASYLQYQVMQAAGVIDKTQMLARYRERMDYARRGYDMGNMPFVEAAPKLREQRRYPTMYWGGAVYFMRVDARLRAHGGSLRQVLRDYVICCRRDARSDRDALINRLDQLSDSRIFSTELARFSATKGFPDMPVARTAQ